MPSITKLLRVRVFLQSAKYRELCKVARTFLGDEDRGHYTTVTRGEYEEFRVYLIHMPTGREVLLATI